jgi:sulfate transport system ATP-binding protein
MTVFENVAFGLRVKPRDERPSEEAIRQRVMDLLSLVQLDWLSDRLPAELSGGQRQRVALARALAVEPKVLLLDEPFGSLDARVRLELRRWLRRLHDTIHLTSLFVTHDQEEALELADRVVLMNHGRIEQEGTPEELFDRPASLFVMDFLGAVNVFDAPAPGGYARAWEMDLSRTEEGGGVWATLDRLSLSGAVCRLELTRETGPPVKAEISRERYEALHPVLGERLFVKPQKLQVFSG